MGRCKPISQAEDDDNGAIDRGWASQNSLMDSTSCKSMAEYYIRMEEGHDETVLTQRVYAEECELLQSWIKGLCC